MRKCLVPVVFLALASCDYDWKEIAPSQETTEAEIIAELEEQERTAADTGAEIVTSVRDGDTVSIKAEWSPYKHLNWGVRVRGIDTGETSHLAKCQQELAMGQNAKAATRKLITESKNLIMLEDIDHDKYGGRFVANVILKDGSSLGDRLIQLGLAKPYTGKGPKPNWCS